MTSSNEIRRSFLDHFAGAGHTVVPSAPLVPLGDPSLMFVNAGMVPFKNVFTGLETRPYVRAASSQKCVRAGGKHNDLDNVGYTLRHHTFFEMLGNFSFGDYFKADAIEHAWALLTREWGIDPARLTVTVYHTDDEAFDLWKRIAGLPDARIIRIASNDNFWSMGDTGPCGPCSEIFFDHGAHIPGGPPGSPDEDGDRFVEIWNLVFMQYEQVDAATRLDLPKPSIDTGMGLERIAAVLQGTPDNFETDTFRALIDAAGALTGQHARGDMKASLRIVADHLRCSGFLIADGVLPSSDGRGYVLRRIMRRAMRHAQLLGSTEPLMWRLVPALAGAMGAAYPELARAQPLIEETLKLEETRFRVTLDRGLRLLDEATAAMAPGATLPGETAFKLYDTYGFPYDLTEDALRGQGLAVDRAGFETAMAEQRRAARAAWTGSGEAKDAAVWFDVLDAVGPTEFVGYTADHAVARVVALVKDGARVDAAEGEVAILVNQTPFYAESGGQMGDAGTIAGERFTATVRDATKALGKLFVHHATVSGEVRVGDEVRLTIDTARRAEVRANHSATHLLHAALRHRLGGHVTQKGSLVAPDRLRFDFAQPRALTAEDIAAVEAEVNRHIRENSPVATRLMTPDAAIAEGRDGAVRRKIWRGGARALHGPRGRWFVVGRTVRRHACGCAGRHRPVQDCGRKRGRRRGAPGGGADRRGRAPISVRARNRAARSRRGDQGAPRGGPRARCRAGRRPTAARTRTRGRQARACAGRRHRSRRTGRARAGRGHRLHRPGHRRPRSQGAARSDRRRQGAAGQRRRSHGRGQRWPRERLGRRHRRSHAPPLRRRSGPPRRRGARRAGRRRAARYGAGGRAGRQQSLRRHRRGARGAREHCGGCVTPLSRKAGEVARSAGGGVAAPNPAAPFGHLPRSAGEGRIAPLLLLAAAVQQILAPLVIGTPGTSPLSDVATRTPMQPATWAFAIWGPIYLGALILAVWQAFGAGAREPALARVRLPLTGLYIGSTVWLAAAASPAKWLTPPILFAMVALALIAMLRLARPARPLSRATKLIAGWPTALYAGWVSAAAFVNSAVIGPEYGLGTAGLGTGGLAVALTAAAAALAIAVTIASRGALAYVLAVVWALTGIIFANARGGSGSLDVMFTATGAAVLLLATLLAIRRTRRA